MKQLHPIRSFPYKNLLAASLVILIHLNLNAQWVEKNNGLYGGSITSFVANGSYIFAGTSAGVFASNNNGISWVPANSGISLYNVNALAVIGDNLFAGTTNGGLFVSADNGSSWKPISTLPVGGTIYALHVIGGSLYATTNNVYVSHDNGANWFAANSGLPNFGAISFASTETSLFAGTYNGVYHSTNVGATWTPANTGMANSTISALAVSGSNLFAATYNLGALQGQGILLSTNSGATWTPVNTGLTNLFVFDLVVSGNYLIAATSGGIFLSTNNGSSWIASSGLINPNALSIAASATTWLAGTDGSGVFLSDDNGNTWTDANTGLKNMWVNSFASVGSKLFAGTRVGRGVYVSNDDGGSWSSAGLSDQRIYALAAIGNNLFAATLDGGIFASSDSGVSWNPANEGLGGNTFFISFTVNGSDLITGTPNGNVFLSTNNAVNWTSIGTGLPSANILCLLAIGTNIFVGTNAGLFISNNNGASWVPSNTGLTSPTIYSLAASGTNIFAGTNNGIFLSSNNGTGWTPINTGLPVSPILSLAINGSKILAGTYYGVFLSVDNGSNWFTFNQPLATPIYGLAIHGSDAYVGTQGMGIWSRTLSEFKAQQSITFSSLVDKTLGDPTFGLTATSSSGLDVGFSSTSDKIGLTNSQVTLVKSGRVTITASQDGDLNYFPAATLDQGFCIKPIKPIVTATNLNTSSPTLTSDATTGNQWYLNNIILPGATNQTLLAAQSGIYKVQVITDDCLSDFSEDQPLIVTGDIASTISSFALYPNPVTDWLILSFGDKEGKKEVALFQLTGIKIEDRKVSGEEVQFNVANYPKGIYIAKVSIDESTKVIRFVKL
jgi:photosystem II stability/assembly factor-like uncharacterized protein